MAEFKLLTYAGDIGPRAGLLVNDLVIDLEAALADHPQPVGFSGSSVISILRAWDSALPVLASVASTANGASVAGPTVRPLSSVRLLAPLLYPNAIYCAAANYTDHMKEMTGKEPPDKTKTRPYFFLKMPFHSIIGPDDPILLPETSEQIDWEAEIGVVIGRRARNVSVAEAMSYVAGYTIVNDLTARDQIRRDDWHFGNDWFRGKSFDTSAPMGPWLTLADDVADPHDISIQLWVNDQLMQDSTSRFMHFTIPEQIAYLSEQITLQPGDVIATGTPAGVGRPRNIYLHPGDRVTITIEGLGTLRNPVAAEAEAVAAPGRPAGTTA